MLKNFRKIIFAIILVVLSIILTTCTQKSSNGQIEHNIELSGELNDVIVTQTENGDESHVVGYQGLGSQPGINLIQHSNFSSDFHSVRYARIWGWSTDGKVAYSFEGRLNSEASYQIDFFILDLVTDNILFSLIIFSEFCESADDWIEGDALFKAHEAAIVDALRTHKIIEQQTDFLPFPITRNNIMYYAQITDFEYGENEEWSFEDTIIRHTLSVTANDRRKAIGTYKPFLWLADVDVCGYFLSPFENKILIVIAEDLGFYQHGGILYRFIWFDLEESFD